MILEYAAENEITRQDDLRAEKHLHDKIRVLQNVINSKDQIIKLLRRDMKTLQDQLIVHRSSHHRCFVKKGALKNFENFTGKYLCWSLFLIKLQAWRLATLLKKDSNTSVFL